MAWKMSVTGKPLSVQLLIDDDPDALDVSVNPHATEHLLELAKLAARKAFARMRVWDERRRTHEEDATQEAAAALWEYAHRGPLVAYGLAKKRVCSWIVRQVFQGKPRRARQREKGIYTLLRLGPSLDEFEREPLWIAECGPAETPEASLLAQEEPDAREACIEALFDVVYDLVAYRMRLERRRHHTAHNDATIFQYTLRGYSHEGIRFELGCAERTVNQRIQRARERLEGFINAHGGVEAVAAGYRTPDGEPLGARNIAAMQRWVADYAGARRAEQEAQSGERPTRHQVEKWKGAARREWLAQQPLARSA